jgi:NAD(P)-dependent dehydrogenase (short-subunit alcohol dehydrogenase family)
MDLGLTGSVALVTGGSDGLGFAAAQRLIVEGANVAICGRDEHRLKDAAERLSAGPGEILAARADVTQTDDLEAFVDAATDRWGRIDALVNNAGTAAGGRFDLVTDADWDADLELKLFAAIRAIRMVLPHLEAVGGGAIVNVLNILAKAPSARTAPTSVSRAAGMALTKVLSKELGPRGIRVNAVLPGLIASGQYRRRAEAAGTSMDQVLVDLASRRDIPLGAAGKEQDFGDLVAFLVSPRAAYITGAAINLDGGLSPVV